METVLCASTLPGSLQLPASAKLGSRQKSQRAGWWRGGNSCRGPTRCEVRSTGATEGPDLSVTVNGLHMPNPFVIGSGPPGTNYTVMKRAFDEGWGGVIAKTVRQKSLVFGALGRASCFPISWI